MALHGLLGYRQPGGDFLIRVLSCDQSENLQFARTGIFFPGMLGQFRRYLRRDPLLPGMNSPDDIQHLAIHSSLRRKPRALAFNARTTCIVA